MRLKVFTTRAGFYDLAVAVSSQPKALAAWGIRQNLFAEGMAQIASDAATTAAALEKPGVVLRRAAGTNDPFTEDPALPRLKSNEPRRTVPRHRALASRRASRD